MNQIFKSVSALCAGAFLTTTACAQEFQSLFNGTNLDGWIQNGGAAKYEVADGCIVGKSVKGESNSFLCTKKDYGNFILELELKSDPQLNSGVQIRSHCYDHVTHFAQGGKTNAIPAGRVHGYQIEVDNRPERRWSGGIYEEGRRGWLQNLTNNPTAQAAFKFGEWNKYRIECDGDHLRTWVNGVPVGDIHDKDESSGFIGLQVHGTPAPNLEVRFRNIRLAELGDMKAAGKP